MITTVFVVSNASINRQLVSENNDQSFKPPQCLFKARNDLHGYSKDSVSRLSLPKFSDLYMLDLGNASDKMVIKGEIV